MIVKQSPGFIVQIRKLLSILGVLISGAQYWIKTKMLDAKNVLLLRPKFFVLPSVAIKKEIGEAQASVSKTKSKSKLILVCDSEQTTYQDSAYHPIPLPMKKKPRTVKAKGQKKTASIIEILKKTADKTIDSVVFIQVFAESKLPIKALPISTVTSIACFFSYILNAPCPKGVVIQEPLLETTRLGLQQSMTTAKGKWKMTVDPSTEEDEHFTPISYVYTQIDMHIEELNDFAAKEINFF